LMHESVMNFVRQALTVDEVAGKSVLEVGSYNVNGSVRSVIEPLRPAEYIGVDMRPGPDVDLVMSAAELTKFFGVQFDVVVSAEMLEHAEDWRAAVRSMKGVLKPGGVLLLTTRSKGFPLHEYPSDFWRFEVLDMRKIFADMDLRELAPDPQVPGVFVKVQQPLSLESIHVMSMEGSK
jgi:SAM-dependent methyltransferase